MSQKPPQVSGAAKSLLEWCRQRYTPGVEVWQDRITPMWSGIAPVPMVLDNLYKELAIAGMLRYTHHVYCPNRHLVLRTDATLPMPASDPICEACGLVYKTNTWCVYGTIVLCYQVSDCVPPDEQERS